MFRIFFICMALLIFNAVFSQENAFKIYNGNGKLMSFKKMNSQLNSSDVVFFGELHNNPIAHWLEYEVANSLSKSKEVLLGAEMLEANDQEFVDLFMQDSLTLEQLDSLGGMWPNFDTDYLPVIEWAKSNKVRVVATNVPRKYASLVYKKGISSLDSLSDAEKKFIAPLPIAFDSTVNCYKQMLDMMPDHSSLNFPMAQAIKDATMAHFIHVNLIENTIFYHINGAYHSENKEGILWYLNILNPKLKVLAITTVSQDDVSKLEKENKGKADFIIVVDSDMNTSY